MIACALIVCPQINRIALRRHRPAFLLGMALVMNVVAGAIVVLTVPAGNLPLLLLPLWFAIGALGLIGANAAAIAMEASRGHPGSGSSLIGVLQFGCAFLAAVGRRWRRMAVLIP